MMPLMIKDITILTMSAALTFAITACASAPKSEPTSSDVAKPEEVVEAAAESPVEVVQQQVSTESDEEYERSTAAVDITKEEFSADKKEILQIISELSVIMEKSDYASWRTYIDPESIAYWSDIKNLSKAARRLPINPKKPLEQQRLNNLEDYFKYVFVRSRKGRAIEEIRYIARNSVKAVEVEGERDIVYYNFVRINGKWMVSIPKT